MPRLPGLDDLSRCTHRTAIGNERLLGISGDQVRFKARVNRRARSPGSGQPDDVTQPRGRLASLSGTEFISRLMQHVVPTGIKRISHHGPLAPAGASAPKTAQQDCHPLPVPWR